MDELTAGQLPQVKVLEKILGEKIITFKLKAIGACNEAFYSETEQGNKFLIKVERTDPELVPNNNLIVEAGIIKTLSKLNLSIPIPEIIFVQEINPPAFAYKYIEGDLMIDVWNNLSDQQKIHICTKLGEFHAEIGEKLTKEIAESTGIKINSSTNIHPDSERENMEILNSRDLPSELIDLIKQAQQIFSQTSNTVFFQFIHNDAHHENIIIKDSSLVGIIDFGESEYGEVAKEFSRYIRDFPRHFEYIVTAYEQASGSRLSRKRLITYAFLSGLSDIVASYRQGGEELTKSKQSIKTYNDLLSQQTAIRLEFN